MLDRSQRPGLASRQRTIGLANASPTIVMAPTFSFSTVSRSSSQLAERSTSVTTEPAWVR